MEVRVLGAVTKNYDQLDQISKEGRGPTDRKSTQVKDGELGSGEVGYHGSCGAETSVYESSRLDILVAISRIGTTLRLNSGDVPSNAKERGLWNVHPSSCAQIASLRRSAIASRGKGLHEDEVYGAPS